jgi:alpha-glucosidase
MRTLIALLLACFFSIPVWGADNFTVASPDGRVQFQLSPGAKLLEYTVTFGGKPVIEASAIGITVDGVNLAEGADIGKADPYKVNETYPWYGNHSTAVDNCNGVRITMSHRQSRTAYTLEVRAYNDGIAFRHLVPGEGTRVPDEATMFRIPSGSRIWFHDLEDHYEAQHMQKSLAAVPSGQWLAPPVTFRLPGETGYIAITEGALVNYSGMVLQGDGDSGFYTRLGHAVPASYPFRLRYPKDVERLTKPASITGAITTPWRVVMIGTDLNALVNCDIVHNVASPPDPKFFPAGLKTDWLQPGRAVWSYLDGGNTTVEGMKQWADYAKTLGFEYNLLEGFWSRWPEAQLKDLVDYSRQRGVRIIVWRSRSAFGDEKSIQEMFEVLRRTGVAGVKIDFFDHEHKEIIDLYGTILRLAAEYHLLVDFHGANKPTGNERTWPNLMGFEGIRGMEMGAPYAMHNATLPFTRMLAGLADYTPTHFSGRRLADTTWAHQVANAIILPAPLLVYAAHPANILANPAADVIKSIPSTWDETVVLPVSAIGDVAAFARRKGNTWFLAMNNGPVAKTLRVDLSFLGDGSYTATLLRDTGEAAALKIETVTARRGDPLYIDLRSGGGFVGRFVK